MEEQNNSITRTPFATPTSKVLPVPPKKKKRTETKDEKNRRVGLAAIRPSTDIPLASPRQRVHQEFRPLRCSCCLPAHDGRNATTVYAGGQVYPAWRTQRDWKLEWSPERSSSRQLTRTSQPSYPGCSGDYGWLIRAAANSLPRWILGWFDHSRMVPFLDLKAFLDLEAPDYLTLFRAAWSCLESDILSSDSQSIMQSRFIPSIAHIHQPNGLITSHSVPEPIPPSQTPTRAQ